MRHYIQKFSIFGRFLLVGLSGTVVNLAVLWLLVTLGLPNFPAALIATEVSIINNFIWNDRWTFRSQSHHPLAARFFRFQLVTSFTAILTLSLFTFFNSRLHLYYLLAQLTAIGIATILNFVVNSKLTWGKTKPALTLTQPAENSAGD